MTSLLGTWRAGGGGPSTRERTVGTREGAVRESVDALLLDGGDMGGDKGGVFDIDDGEE